MDTHIIDLPDAIVAPNAHSAEPPAAEGISFGPPPSDQASGSLAATDPADAPEAGRPKRRRPILLATAAAVILASVGGGYLISPYNTIYPLDAARLRTQGQHIVDAVRQETAAVVAPAAKIASSPLPERAAPVRPLPTATPTRDEERAEILALRDQPPRPQAKTTVSETGDAGRLAGPTTKPLPAPARSQADATTAPIRTGALGFETGGVMHAQSAPRSVAVGEQGATSAPIQAASSSAVDRTTVPQPGSDLPSPAAVFSAVQAANQPVPTQPSTSTVLPDPAASGAQSATSTTSAVVAPSVAASKTEPAPPVEALRRAAKPADPVAVVAALQAAPMSPREQIQVLNEVARLAIVVRDIRAENEALRARVESTADRFDQAVADFTRRLALAEAHGAINAAMGVEPSNAASRTVLGGKGSGQPELAVPVPQGGRASTEQGTRIVPVSTVVPGAVIPAGAVRYRVTAASPGLAMLAQIDRSGGEGSQIQIGIGDQVPGYGKVTAIQQRGASWVVQTDKGPDKGAIQ